MPRHIPAIVVLLCLLAAAIGPGAPAGPTLDFIHLTDTHVMDDTGAAMTIAVARMHFAEAGERLAAFLSSAARRPPAFFLVTGDLTDAYRMEGADGRPVLGQIEAFRRASAGSPAPLYLALGNHDLFDYTVVEGAVVVKAAEEEARAAWTAGAECFRRGSWYSFRQRVGRTAYLFLVLDTGLGSAPIGPEQARWIRKELAERRGAAAILATHFPLSDRSDNAVSHSIREAAAAGGVVLVLAGHLHTSAVQQVVIGPDTAVQVRTAAFAYDDGNWRRIRLLEDRIEVFATGDPDRVEQTIPVPAAQPAAASISRRTSASSASTSAR